MVPTLAHQSDARSISMGSMAIKQTTAFILPSEAYRIDDFIEAAGRLGVDVVVATDAHHALAEDMGARLVPIDFDDPADAAIRIAGASAHMDAIVSVDDRGVEVAAAAAELRQLSHNPPSAVAATRNKATARRALDGIVEQPPFRVVNETDDLAGVWEQLGGPVVVKPTGLAGSIGVSRANSLTELIATVAQTRAIQSAHGYLAETPLLVERFIAGPEIAIEGLLTAGTWDTLAVFDKPDPLEGPHFAETIYVTPSRLSPALLEAIESAAAAACGALGLLHGPIHAEFRIADNGPVLLELAARPIGGLCGRALRFGLADTSLEELIIRNALGERVRGTRLAPGASGVAMLPVPVTGTFTGINHVAEAQAISGVTAVEVSRIAGRLVAPVPEESTYLGFVFARGDTPDAVETSLRLAVDTLDIVITSDRD